MLSYNYTSGYDFLSYMEYPVLLLQEYALIYYAFKYQDLLGKRTQLVAADQMCRHFSRTFSFILILFPPSCPPPLAPGLWLLTSRKNTFFRVALGLFAFTPHFDTHFTCATGQHNIGDARSRTFSLCGF